MAIPRRGNFCLYGQGCSLECGSHKLKLQRKAMSQLRRRNHNAHWHIRHAPCQFWIAGFWHWNRTQKVGEERGKQCWLNRSCVNMSLEDYFHWGQIENGWVCPKCDREALPFHNVSQLSSSSSNLTNTSFFSTFASSKNRMSSRQLRKKQGIKSKI